ncbi:MAG TPA: fibronectin type III domain-containing protein [Verrucomicrobiae bacterium]
MQMYSGRFDNGWGDSWSWMPRYPTNNPVFTSNVVFVASNSMALAPSGQWQAWWLKAGTSVDTTIYTNVTFWINGGTTGGQTISVQGELNGSSSGLPSVPVTAQAGWAPVTISLSSLGINNKSNLTGFQIGNQTSLQPFFIDDMRLVAAPVPATVHVSVNANQTVRTVSDRVFGVNEVAWDGSVNSAASVSIVNNIGATCLRWPGGSWGDGYHWTNENMMAGDTSPRYWGSFSPDFISLATNTHCQAFIIANYGTSTPEEAAWGVRMFNVTNHCHFKYWEIGNEVGGSWEWDWNTNAPFKAHDPWTYAMRFTNYYAQMKAADPTIKIGAVVDTTEDGTINNYDHPVVNPRTGATHYGWTPVVLAYLRTNNCLPDFVIEHNYGPAAGDTQDLLWPKVWTTDAANVRQMLNDYLGNAASNVTMEITENGTGGDKQGISLPGGLFYADSLGQIMQTEFNSRIWWAMRNGGGPVTDPDPAFYGWRKDGSGNYVSDGGIVTGDGVGANGYPTYYVAKLLTHFARGGDTVVSASSDYNLLATYAVKRTNGTLTLLVINKSCASNLTANFNLSGYLPFTNATVYSYGIPQDEAARTGIGSMDIQTNNASFQTASMTFAPFSASVLELSPGNAAPLAPANLVAASSNAVAALTWSAANGAASYIVQRSITSGGNYTTIATGVSATNFFDTGLVNGGTYYYVVAAANTYGVSSNSAEVSATPMAKLAGTIIGSSGSWSNLGNTITNVFDGNTNTYYDAVNGTGDWAGMDLGSNAVVLQIKYCPRAGFAGRMIGGQFQGANTSNFSSGVTTIFTVTTTPPDGAMTVQAVTNATSFRYLRYIGPAGGYCNVAEVEFWGFAPVVPSAPANLTATNGDASVALNWSPASNAVSYYLKRSLTSGGGFTTIATNASLVFTNTGLTNGTLYYFVVSALNGAGESGNSLPIGARPTSFAPTPLGFSSSGNQLQLNWPVDHTGWQLQAQTNGLTAGLSTNWSNISGSAETNQITLPLSATDEAVFFRLIRP